MTVFDEDVEKRGLRTTGAQLNGHGYVEGQGLPLGQGLADMFDQIEWHQICRPLLGAVGRRRDERTELGGRTGLRPFGQLDDRQQFDREASADRFHLEYDVAGVQRGFSSWRGDSDREVPHQDRIEKATEHRRDYPVASHAVVAVDLVPRYDDGQPALALSFDFEVTAEFREDRRIVRG